jgi:hypothetical protein
MAATHDFALDQGTDWARTLNCANSDGTPVDFGIGAYAKMQCRPFIGATGSPLIEATCTVTPSTGTIKVEIAHADSSLVNVNTLDSGKITENGTIYNGYICYYDLEVTWGEGPSIDNVTRLIQGRICINPEVTLSTEEHLIP